MNKRKLLFADNASLSLNDAARLAPATLLRELFRGFEEALDRGDLVVVSPDSVDREHRTRWSQVDEPHPPRKLFDQRADDEADAAAVCDVAPNGRTGSVEVDLGLETSAVTGSDDRVVIAGRHLVRPQLQRLVAQAGQLDLVAVGEAMMRSHGHAHDLASDRPLTDVFGIGGQRCEREIAPAVAQEGRDVAAEDLAGLDLQQRIVPGEPVEE